MLGSDKTIKAVGVIPAVVFRHEQGHCNGWGSDHKGARAIVIPRPAPRLNNGACAREAAGTIGLGTIGYARPVLFYCRGTHAKPAQRVLMGHIHRRTMT